MSLAKETDGGRGTSFSVNAKRMFPANVMDRAGSGVWSNDTGVSNEVVDDGSEIGNGALEMSESVGIAAVDVFSAVF